MKTKVKRCILHGSFLLALSLLSTYCNPQTFLGEKQGISSSLLLGLVAATSGNCDSGNDLWARDLVTQRSVCVATRLAYEGSNTQVFVERSAVLPFSVEDFGQEFDTQTYPILVDAFGPPSDVDGDGKVKLLLFDIRDGANGTGAYVAGFYDPINYFPDNVFSPVRSNFAEVLYLDARELVASLSQDPTALASTAAHEFQHLQRFPRMYENNQFDDLWINEGTSEVASDLAGFGPQTSRINCYLGRIDSRCSDGINGVSLVDWDSSTADVLKQYSYAYVFMKYLSHIAGTNDTDRLLFLQKTVLGNSVGLRANETDTLMTLFRESPNYNASLLGNDSKSAFFRFFALLLGKSFAGMDLSSVERKNASSTETLDLTAAALAYPLPTDLVNLSLLGVNPTTRKTQLAITSANFYNTSTPALPGMVNAGKITDLGPGKGILFWGDYLLGGVSLNFASTKSQKARLKTRSVKEVLLTHPIGTVPICGLEFTNDSVHTHESIPIE